MIFKGGIGMAFEKCMKIGIEEAETSLREGNSGFGAVILKNGKVLARAHDGEKTKNDPTAHAEMNAIREACSKLGEKPAGCILVSTHEPCPMCATAIVWSGIAEIAYGYAIEDALTQGRRRMRFSCAEVFEREGARVKIHAGILKEECGILYRSDVRAEIDRLRHADESAFMDLSADSIRRRTEWFHENKAGFEFISSDLLDSAYRLLLKRLRISEKEAPIVQRSENRIVFHSMNFCPTLEACRILGLDTRDVCKKMNEASTDILLKQIDSRLRFSRNYDKIRPYSPYCEEAISLTENERINRE
jgi:tRNA(Arg) A34 adenosine deaminase TadA